MYESDSHGVDPEGFADDPHGNEAHDEQYASSSEIEGEVSDAIDLHRWNEVHAEEQPPQSHGNGAHDDTYATETYVDDAVDSVDGGGGGMGLEYSNASELYMSPSGGRSVSLSDFTGADGRIVSLTVTANHYAGNVVRVAQGTPGDDADVVWFLEDNDGDLSLEIANQASEAVYAGWGMIYVPDDGNDVTV